MIKILLKHVNTKSIKYCQEDVAKISKIAIKAKSTSIPNISIFSVKELDDKGEIDNNSRLSVSDKTN